MMANEKLLIDIQLDTGNTEAQFRAFEAQAKKSADGAGKAFQKAGDSLDGLGGNLPNISSGINNIGLAFTRLLGPIALVSTAIAGIRSSIQLIQEAERDAQIGNAFELSAQNAGIAADRLRSALDQARGGVVDLDDLLLVASRTINELPEAAERLPELFEVARKAAILYGGTALDNFEKINQAILTGNTRQLRNIGIYTDQTKAAKEYADAIGISVAALGEQEKRLALINAIASRNQTQFASVNLEQETLAVRTERLAVSIGELFETIGAALLRSFGPSLKSVLDQTITAVNLLVKDLSPASDGIAKIESEIGKLDNRIKVLQSGIGQDGVLRNLFGNTDEELQAQIAKLTEQRKALLAELAKAQVEQNKEVSNSGKITRELTEAQLREIETNTKAFNQRLLDINNQSRQAELAAKLIGVDEETRVNLLIEDARLQHTQRLDAIEKEFQNKLGISKAEFQAIQLAEEDRFNKEKERLQKESDARRKAQQDKDNQLYLQAAQAVTQSTTAIISSGLQRVGASLLEGGKAWSGFREQILNIIGDLLINVGQSFLSLGALVEAVAAGLKALFGGNIIAAGIAAIALGGLLKSAAGSSLSRVTPTSAAPAPTFSGGITDTGGFPVQEPIGDSERRREVSTNVEVVINGDILDSDDTGSRVIDLINRAYDKQGVTIRRGAVS